MTFKQFMKSEQKILKAFEEYWIKNNSEYKDNFPMKLGNDDFFWFEQYKSFRFGVYKSS